MQHLQEDRVITGICSVCEQYTVIHHKVELKRSNKILASYCLSCFDICFV